MTRDRQWLGVKNHKAKLTEEDIILIRETYATKEVSQRELADKFEVGHNTIFSIVSGATWRHVKAGPDMDNEALRSELMTLKLAVADMYGEMNSIMKQDFRTATGLRQSRVSLRRMKSLLEDITKLHAGAVSFINQREDKDI